MNSNTLYSLTGEFGVVYQAEVTLPVSKEEQTVALKTLKGEDNG